MLIEQARRLIEEEMRQLTRYQRVPLFYDPIDYMLGMGGKKVRPVLLWLSCGMAGGDPRRALPAAAAVELLHDFSLVHDDIMDNDETRRGKPTIHKRWDLNTAILAGDGLLGFAFQKLLQSDTPRRAELAEELTRAMIVICEGQALDKQFENDSAVTTEAYMDMIQRKTAALIEVSCVMGGIVAGADGERLESLRTLGHSLGMAFQLQDDMLDIMADEAALGKKVGSDFEMHKQTILAIRLRERLGAEAFARLDLAGYRQALQEEGVLQTVDEQIRDYFKNTFDILESFEAGPYAAALKELILSLKNRTY